MLKLSVGKMEEILAFLERENEYCYCIGKGCGGSGEAGHVQISCIYYTSEGCATSSPLISGILVPWVGWLMEMMEKWMA